MSLEEIKVMPDVFEFIGECSKIIGEFEKEDFALQQWRRLNCPVGGEKPIESPIEQLLYCAFDVLRRINIETMFNRNGLDLEPQVEIGDYRVDFLATYNRFEGKNGYKKIQVVIECDSQKFHDRTEQERRYEKARDRFLQSKDYKVFRYTGKEINENPFKVAGEIIAHLMGCHVSEVLDPQYLPHKYI